MIGVLISYASIIIQKIWVHHHFVITSIIIRFSQLAVMSASITPVFFLVNGHK